MGRINYQSTRISKFKRNHNNNAVPNRNDTIDLDDVSNNNLLLNAKCKIVYSMSATQQFNHLNSHISNHLIASPNTEKIAVVVISNGIETFLKPASDITITNLITNNKITVYLCENSMNYLGYVGTDFVDGVKFTQAGVAAIAYLKCVRGFVGYIEQNS